MKFPSLKSLSDGLVYTVKRFPFEILFALAGTVAAITSTEWLTKTDLQQNWLIRVILIANLGFLLSLAINLYLLSVNNIKANAKILIKIIAALLALSLIFMLNPEERRADYFRFFLLSLSFHLLVSFAAFTGKGHLQGFWQFNKTIFLRVLTAVLYSGVLYAGLVTAITATNFLFNLNINSRIYLDLWCLIAGLFNTIFFLAGVPEDTKVLDDDHSYPKGLKVFTQYVLIPLATVYLLILLAYEVKLVAQWSLPKGWVSTLILGYAVFGILSILLVYPVRTQDGNKWIKTFARSFYCLLIPLLVLLFWAISRRVFAYGITEQRYFLLLLGCWLLFITVYFLLPKKQNIKLIPVSLCILTLLSIYGPQSAFSVSAYSQNRILIGVFKKYNAFKKGKLMPLNRKIEKADAKQAIDKLRYLIDQKDLKELQPYFKADLNAVTDSLKRTIDRGGDLSYYNKWQLTNKELAWAKSYLALNNVSDSVDVEFVGNDGSFYSFTTKKNRAVDITGYAFMLMENDAYGYSSKSSIGKTLIEQKADNRHIYTLMLDDEKVSFDLNSLADTLVQYKTKQRGEKHEIDKRSVDDAFIVPDTLMTITKQTIHYVVTLKITRIEFRRNRMANYQPKSLIGVYLVKRK